MISELETLDQVLERRRIAVQRAMAERGITVLFMYGLSSYAASGALGHGYIRYLHRLHDPGSAASAMILPAEGLPTLLVPSGFDQIFIRESIPWVEQAIAESPANYGKLARQLIGSPNGAVGLIGQGDYSSSVYRGLIEGNDAEFRDATEILDEMRAIKDDFELSRHRRAAEISDRMYERLLEVLPAYSGPTYGLMAAMEGMGRSLGAEMATVWMATGQPADRARFRVEETEREVRRGDQILIGTYVTYRGYWAHCLRMGSLGKPSEMYQRIYDATAEQHRQCAELIQVGRNASDIQTLANELENKLFPVAGKRHPTLARHAHFMGLDYADKPTPSTFPQPSEWSQFPPAAAPGVTLRPRMVMEMHTGIGKDNVGFGFIGDLYTDHRTWPRTLDQVSARSFCGVSKNEPEARR